MRAQRSLSSNSFIVFVTLAIGACATQTDRDPGEGPVRSRIEALSAAIHTVPQSSHPYTLFETLQVRPLALAPNGKQLFACNTPDNRLEIFSVRKGGLQAVGSVAVGLEPIAVAARTQNEVWVVNHLSDSVSIVQVDNGGSSRVVRTLLVGDEPRDIVFGGPDRSRAFITTAHRGQNSPDDPDLFNPDTGRADVWVFDANDLGSAPGGTRLTKLTLFADTPRALAVSADGSRVYAAPFFSGNQTTVASADAVRHVYAEYVDPNNPNVITFPQLGIRQRITSLVVKYRAGQDGNYHWVDAQEGRVFDDWIKVSLPDDDVFTIDASANPPAVIDSQTYVHVGTTIFNMAVNPVSGAVYVANTEAHNDVRFEGHNPSLPVTSVRGRIVDSRISVLDPSGGGVVHNDLNSHVVNGSGDASLSRAFPQDLAVSANGKRLFVTAQGSAKLGVYDTAALAAGSSPLPTAQNQVLLSAGGPTGVVLDEANQRAYVLTRFDDGISTVSLTSLTETSHLQLFNPEPVSVTDGRRFLYDATGTSENGTQACASCHIGGDLDALSWDLGNPGALRLPITKLAVTDPASGTSQTTIWTFPPSILKQVIPGSEKIFDEYEQLKGPMTTQSLRGLDNHGSMHWRGDRNGAVQQDGTPFIDPATHQPVVSAQADQGIFDELKAFESFNVAFFGLVGRAAQLPVEDMAAFTSFALDITYPPNPIRNLDNSLTPVQQAGRNIYFQTNANGGELTVDGLHNCNGCHTLDPNGNLGLTDHPGFFGTRGRLSFENLPQTFKVAHLRNAYQKVGMFASSPDSNRTLTPIASINPPKQAVRGFGYQPDGAVGSILHHLSGRGFVKTTANPGGIPTFTFDANGNATGIDPSGFAVRQAIASFVLAYDSNMRPIVGQQLTLTADNAAASSTSDRIALLEARATAGDCDLVVKSWGASRERGYVYSNGAFVPDTSSAPLSDAQLRALVGASTDALTFTCVPPGSGWRIGVDRDGDGYADGDELAAGTDPASAASHPGS